MVNECLDVLFEEGIGVNLGRVLVGIEGYWRVLAMLPKVGTQRNVENEL